MGLSFPYWFVLHLKSTFCYEQCNFTYCDCQFLSVFMSVLWEKLTCHVIPFCLLLYWNGLSSLYSCMCLQGERCWKRKKKVGKEKEKEKSKKKKKVVLASGWLWAHPIVVKGDSYVANMEACVGMTVTSLQTWGWEQKKKKKTKVKLDIVVVGWVGIDSLILNVLLAWSWQKKRVLLDHKNEHVRLCDYLVRSGAGVDNGLIDCWRNGFDSGPFLSISLSYFLVQLPPNSHQLSRRRWKVKMVRENKKSDGERCWTLSVGSPLVSLGLSFFFFNGERMKLSMFPSNNRAMMACCMMVCEMIWMHWWCDGLSKKQRWETIYWWGKEASANFCFSSVCGLTTRTLLLFSSIYSISTTISIY